MILGGPASRARIICAKHHSNVIRKLWFSWNAADLIKTRVAQQTAAKYVVWNEIVVARAFIKEITAITPTDGGIS